MEFRSFLKFLVKMKIVAPMRRAFLFLRSAPVTTEGWDKRVLIINLEALGDLVLFTSVLKLYKKSFPDKKIYLVVKSGVGLEKIFVGGFVDEAITLDYRRFAVNPFYGMNFINKLRGIGFETVIAHDFSAAEIMGKIISVGIGAQKVIGYEGLGVEWRAPFDLQQAENLRTARDEIFPKFTKLIPSIDKDLIPRDRLASAARHYVAIYEGVAGKSGNADYSTFLPSPPGAEEAAILNRFGLAEGGYAILGVGASVPYKRWPALNFSKVAELLADRGLKVVLVGSRGDFPAASELKNAYFPEALDLTSKTTLDELVTIVRKSVLIFTNDTSLVHFAVALKKPSVCVTGGGQFGMFANYGYPEINKWLYKKTDCFFDSWRCGKNLEDGESSPCLAAVAVSRALEEVELLLARAEKKEVARDFRVEFEPERREKTPRKKIRVVYAGIRNDNYNPKRSFSFEYNNFYKTLKAMDFLDVIEYQYDPIIAIGRRRFNRELLSLIRNEKPDLFFAFMFSDEFEPETLNEIKKITKSVAWFADDQWRIHNYSRFYAPHFTSAVTTWSEAPALYGGYGVGNVIRSQWACNERIWKPLPLKKEIDVSFVGQRTDARARLVEELRRAGIKTHVRGWGWPGGRASQEEMVKIFSSSKINLNINDAPSLFSSRLLGRLVLRRSANKFVPSFDLANNFKSWKNMNVPQIKARPFELAGCGAFVISGQADDMGKYYKENEEVVFYKDTDDLIQKIKYYLNHEKERERIADAAYKRTLAEHTYEKRFENIFRKIGL